ncbi:MAG: hypothetical protein HY696_02465 [Deltaproteobacteria bacterium]|nr:hypothetical protein [Deltaproteobacteria bacterium]
MGARPGAVRHADAVYDHALRTGGTVADAWRAVREGQHRICFVTAAGEDPGAEAAALASAGRVSAPLTWSESLGATGIGNALIQLAAREPDAAQRPVRLTLRPNPGDVVPAFFQAVTTSAKLGDTRGVWQAVVELYDHQRALVVRYGPAVADQPRRFEFPLTATTQVAKALRDLVRNRVVPLGAAYGAERVEIHLAVTLDALREHSRKQLTTAATEALERCRAAGWREVVIRTLQEVVAALQQGVVVANTGRAPHPSGTAVGQVDAPASMHAIVALMNRAELDPCSLPLLPRWAVALPMEGFAPPLPVETRIPRGPSLTATDVARELLSATPAGEGWTAALLQSTLQQQARDRRRVYALLRPFAVPPLQLLATVESDASFWLLATDGMYLRHVDAAGQLRGYQYCTDADRAALVVEELLAMAAAPEFECLRQTPFELQIATRGVPADRHLQQWAQSVAAWLRDAGYEHVIITAERGPILAATDMRFAEAATDEPALLASPPTDAVELVMPSAAAAVREAWDALPTRLPPAGACVIDGSADTAAMVSFWLFVHGLWSAANPRRGDVFLRVNGRIVAHALFDTASGAPLGLEIDGAAVTVAQLRTVLITDEELEGGKSRLIFAPLFAPVEIRYRTPTLPAGVAALFPLLEESYHDMGFAALVFSTPLRQFEFGTAASIGRWTHWLTTMAAAFDIPLQPNEARSVAEYFLWPFGIKPLLPAVATMLGADRGRISRNAEGYGTPLPGSVVESCRRALAELRLLQVAARRQIRVVSLGGTDLPGWVAQQIKTAEAFDAALMTAPDDPRKLPFLLLWTLGLIPDSRFSRLSPLLQTVWDAVVKGMADPRSYLRLFTLIWMVNTGSGKAKAKGRRRLDLPEAGRVEVIRLQLIALVLELADRAVAPEIIRGLYQSIHLLPVPLELDSTAPRYPLASSQHPYGELFTTLQQMLPRLELAAQVAATVDTETLLAETDQPALPVTTALSLLPTMAAQLLHAGLATPVDVGVNRTPLSDRAWRATAARVQQRLRVLVPPTGNGAVVTLPCASRQLFAVLDGLDVSYPLLLQMPGAMSLHRAVDPAGRVSGLEFVCALDAIGIVARMLLEHADMAVQTGVALRGVPITLTLSTTRTRLSRALQRRMEAGLRQLRDLGFPHVVVRTRDGNVLAATDALPAPDAVDAEPAAHAPPAELIGIAAEGRAVIAGRTMVTTSLEPIEAWRRGDCEAVLLDCTTEHGALSVLEDLFGQYEYHSEPVGTPRGDAFIRVAGQIVAHVSVDPQRRAVLRVWLNGAVIDATRLVWWVLPPAEQDNVGGTSRGEKIYAAYPVEIHIPTLQLPSLVAEALPAFEQEFRDRLIPGIVLRTPLEEFAFGHAATLARWASIFVATAEPLQMEFDGALTRDLCVADWLALYGVGVSGSGELPSAGTDRETLLYRRHERGYALPRPELVTDPLIAWIWAESLQGWLQRIGTPVTTASLVDLARLGGILTAAQGRRRETPTPETVRRELPAPQAGPVPPLGLLLTQAGIERLPAPDPDLFLAVWDAMRVGHLDQRTWAAQFVVEDLQQLTFSEAARQTALRMRLLCFVVEHDQLDEPPAELLRRLYGAIATLPLPVRVEAGTMRRPMTDPEHPYYAPVHAMRTLIAAWRAEAAQAAPAAVSPPAVRLSLGGLLIWSDLDLEAEVVERLLRERE